jgi:hypothetical protein
MWNSRFSFMVTLMQSQLEMSSLMAAWYGSRVKEFPQGSWSEKPNYLPGPFQKCFSLWGSLFSGLSDTMGKNLNHAYGCDSDIHSLIPDTSSLLSEHHWLVLHGSNLPQGLCSCYSVFIHRCFFSTSILSINSFFFQILCQIRFQRRLHNSPNSTVRLLFFINLHLFLHKSF